MTTPAAIIIGSALIAIGVAGGLVGARFVPRYQLMTAGADTLRMDTRTGEIAHCQPFTSDDEAVPNRGLTQSRWLCYAVFYPR